MMSIMDSVLCETATTPGAIIRSTSSAPAWADVNLLPRDAVGAAASSPDGGQSDAASSSSYIISSSGLIDQSSDCRHLMMSGSVSQCADMETRDSSPQSTSFDGYDHHPHLMTHQQLLMKKSHNNKPHRVSDPTSHRIIEKRRRDRMNNCLTNLSKLIPSAYLKKGRGRIEKTEIIEMAIRYMKHVELERRQEKREQMELQEELMLDKSVGTDENEGSAVNGITTQHSSINQQQPTMSVRNFGERYRQGFFDCIAETLRFLAGAEGLTVNDQMKTRLLFHLREYFGRLADYESQQHSSSTNSTNETRPEDTDEPLNMSMKRPRNSATPSRYPLSQQPSNAAEMPSSSSISSGGGDVRYHGSQLRDILETKEPFSLNQTPSSKYAGAVLTTPKSEQTSTVHLPHSSMPSMFMQQKFTNSNSVFEQKSACGGGGGLPLGSTVADCNSRSVSGLLTNSTASSFGGRSTSSSNATTTSQYPSSPGSSVNSFVMESPPGLHSPPLPPSMNSAGGFSVPIFALHPVGLFYVPLTVNSHLLDSTFNASVLLCGNSENGNGVSSTVQQMAAAALSTVTHPVTVNVNFNFLPNMANVVSNVNAQQNQNRSMTRGHQGLCQTSSNAAAACTQTGVILNTAAYASNLRLALKH